VSWSSTSCVITLKSVGVSNNQVWIFGLADQKHVFLQIIFTLQSLLKNKNKLLFSLERFSYVYFIQSLSYLALLAKLFPFEGSRLDHDLV